MPFDRLAEGAEAELSGGGLAAFPFRLPPDGEALVAMDVDTIRDARRLLGGAGLGESVGVEAEGDHEAVTSGLDGFF